MVPLGYMFRSWPLCALRVRSLWLAGWEGAAFARASIAARSRQPEGGAVAGVRWEECGGTVAPGCVKRYE
ncbi:hypothetical protein GCM10022402_39670 [Salinactinospora qingdaonensis]|uniref:Secreted protein n=1 Tax=Salinactinospora qingdaonensis TaxID=702744 RepID=A0ABP7G6U6_9ACTN